MPYDPTRLQRHQAHAGYPATHARIADRILARAELLLPMLLAEALAARPARKPATDDTLADAARVAIRAAQIFEREALQFRAECPGGEVSPATATGVDDHGGDHHTS